MLPSSESTLLCSRDDVTMVHKCKQSTTTSRTHVKKNFQVNTLHNNFKAWMDFYHHCVCPWSYLKYAFSIYKVNLWQTIQGIPMAILMLSNLHNYPWVVLLQRTAFQRWRNSNQGILLAEKGSPKLHRATSWQNEQQTNMLFDPLVGNLLAPGRCTISMGPHWLSTVLACGNNELCGRTEQLFALSCSPWQLRLGNW